MHSINIHSRSSQLSSAQRHIHTQDSPRIASYPRLHRHQLSPPAVRRLQRISATPPQPADRDPGSGPALGAPHNPEGSPADNGTQSGATATAAPAAAAASHARGAGSVNHLATFDENIGDVPFVSVSARSSFRSVLKQAYTGEMLFVVIGSLICAAVAQWTVGTPLRRFNPYTFQVTLTEAPGVDLGTPVRMKGVPIGSVLSASPQLHSVQVQVEVNEAKTIIPRNAKFELTQSGLIPAASIDISPPEGINADVLTAAATAAVRRGKAGRGTGEAGGEASSSSPSSSRASKRAAVPVRLASPKDVAACRLQGVLVCQGDQLDGMQGGSMDELMGHMLKTLRKGEEEADGGIVPGRGPLQG